MYLDFFGFQEQPFGVTPDPRYLYLSPGHREALASLHYGIEANCGFLSLIAGPGMGKTTMLFHLLSRLDPTARTAFVFQTQCTSREFMRFLLTEIGIDVATDDFVRMHELFNRCLMQESRAGRRFIVIVDEAQNLEEPVLETVRLLSDFETPRAKLLQIILAGQPGLAEKLTSPSLIQLRQRISSVTGLSPLTPKETRDLIDHRLRVAGYRGAPLFSQEALELIAEFTEGIPRQINKYCFHALSLACGARKHTVDAGMVCKVAHDLDLQRFINCTNSFRLSALGPGSKAGVHTFPSAMPDLEGSESEPSPVVGSEDTRKDGLSPAEAVVYMRNLARVLNRNSKGPGRSDRKSS